jgi:cupin fold WbuC family metalloprotein
METVKLIDRDLFRQLLAAAWRSPRRRVNHNFHASLQDNPHRFLNVMLRGSYFTPHRHQSPPKSETFLVLEGRLAFVIFDDTGRVTGCRILDATTPTLGIDIGPGIWHTLVVLSEHCVCFEVKPGPYDAANDKEFAAWAPPEGDAGCGRYLDTLVQYVQQQNAAQQ